MPIPDEKARAWTRPEDYWPPRRPRRTGRQPTHALRRVAEPSEPVQQPRLMLGVIPYMLLMLGLAVLSFAIMVVAWPDSTPKASPPVPATAEVGTAPKGWIEG